MILNRFKQAARTFIKSVPANFQKARTFVNMAVTRANQGQKLLTHVAQGIQENPTFHPKLQQAAARMEGATSLGLRKLNELHAGSNKFLDHLERSPNIGFTM